MSFALNNSVLLVDDSTDLLDLLKLTIEYHCHCKAITAENLEELKANRDEVMRCRLAILDINLGPDQPNGIDVYQWLRAGGFPGEIAFLTGHAANHPLVADAAKIGDARVFNKPLAAKDLLKLVSDGHFPSVNHAPN